MIITQVQHITCVSGVFGAALYPQKRKMSITLCFQLEGKDWDRGERVCVCVCLCFKINVKNKPENKFKSPR